MTTGPEQSQERAMKVAQLKEWLAELGPDIDSYDIGIALADNVIVHDKIQDHARVIHDERLIILVMDPD